MRTILAALAATTALALAGCNTASRAAEPTSRVDAAPVAAKSGPRTVTVQANGRVTGKPDTMTLTIGVESRGPTARAALDRNNQRAGDVIASLKASGIAPDDLQTSQLSVSPTYDDRGHVTGYSVSNMVTAKLHQIDNAGKVIDAAAAFAGDDIRVGGVQFSIEDTGKLAGAARAEAMKQAKQHASDFASAAGASLGAVQKITETAASVPTPIAYAGAADVAKSAPVEPGTQEVGVTVTVVYALG
ncbi:MAG: SIMPL domain-containing protein [Acidimicrobiia bacterium]